MSCFSTYFGHHMSTIEGGFVTTNNKKTYNMLKSLRSHGWDRDLDRDEQVALQDYWNISEFDALCTFYNFGYNLRSTDLQAYIGLGQIDKLDNICEQRNENFKKFKSKINNNYWSVETNKEDYVSNFAFPIIHPHRNVLATELRANNVEVRPLICGSMGTQPFYVKKFGKLSLPNVSIVDKYGMYLPNNPGLTDKDIDYMCCMVNDFTRGD